MISFLNNAQLDLLIDSGNCLLAFSKTSLILPEIVAALKDEIPDVKAAYFGSKVSGVGYEDDLVSLHIDDGGKTISDESVEVLYAAVEKFLASNAEEWSILQMEKAGKKSYLKIKNLTESTACWISFNSRMACANSALVQHYVASYPMCQKLSYFVQEITKMVGLDFNRYLVIILVIFYLQIKGCVPTVAQLQGDLEDETNIDGWVTNFNATFSSSVKLKDCEPDLRKCAAGFFTFYGTEMNLQEYVVCPHVGLAISQKDFLPGNEWRLPIKRYKTHIEAEQLAQADGLISRFAIINPCVCNISWICQ